MGKSYNGEIYEIISDKQKEILTRQQSKQTLTSYNKTQHSQTVFPKVELVRLTEFVESDPVANGAITHFVDKCMEGGWNIWDSDDDEPDFYYKDMLQTTYNFNKEVLKKIFYQGKLMQNVFVELVRGEGSGRVKAINVVDGTGIEPITAHNGDPIRFKGRRPNPETGKFPYWETDEMLWIKFKDRSRGYSELQAQSIMTAIWLKRQIYSFMGYVWETNQYKPTFVFKDSDSKQIEDALTYMKNSEDFKELPYVMRGTVDHFMVRAMEENQHIISLLSKLDEEILINLRVPPNDAGKPDGSGRSNADAQSNNLLTAVRSYKDTVSDFCNYELFPKLKRASKRLVWKPHDKFQETSILENVNKMANAGFSEDLIKEYMVSKGLIFKTKDWFKKEPEPQDNPGQGDDSTLTKKQDIDLMESRRKDEGSLEKQGTGEESSTRDDQIIKRQLKFKKYPYVYEAGK